MAKRRPGACALLVDKYNKLSDRVTKAKIQEREKTVIERVLKRDADIGFCQRCERRL